MQLNQQVIVYHSAYRSVTGNSTRKPAVTTGKIVQIEPHLVCVDLGPYRECFDPKDIEKWNKAV